MVKLIQFFPTPLSNATDILLSEDIPFYFKISSFCYRRPR